jgi:hypothetical protein
MLVNGNWTQWTNWTDCSDYHLTNSSWYQYRDRNCSNPEPRYNGICPGGINDNTLMTDFQYQLCNPGF